MLHTARLSLVLVLALVVQTTWMADLRPFGVTGDLLLLCAIAAGLVGGSARGATVGFVAGFALDLVLTTPLGMSALAYLVVGYAAGSAHEGVLRSAPWIPVLVAFVATAVGIVFYVMLGQIVGQQLRLPTLPRIVVVTSVMNALLALPATWVMGWVERAATDPVTGRSGGRVVGGFR